MKNIGYKLYSILFLGLLICMMLLFPLVKDEKYSTVERRTLKQKPKFTIEAVLNGKYMKEFEEYALDQFPFRNQLRAIKSETLLRSEYNDLYEVDGYIVKMEPEINYEVVKKANQTFQNLNQTYLKENNCRVFFSIIPDKNYFLAKQSGHLAYDYEEMKELYVDQMDFAEYIDIFDTLTIEKYYKTDTHWRQECLMDTANQITEAMCGKQVTDYEVKGVDTLFYGVYYGQFGKRLPADELKYCTNATIEQMTAYNHEKRKEAYIHDLEKAQGNDPYEMFLSGNLSLVTITNEAADTDKTLILFRDSFGSSIAPLLAQHYAKTIVVDIRYISSGLLGNFIDFENADVLFLYSTLVLNSASFL